MAATGAPLRAPPGMFLGAFCDQELCAGLRLTRPWRAPLGAVRSPSGGVSGQPPQLPEHTAPCQQHAWGFSSGTHSLLLSSPYRNTFSHYIFFCILLEEKPGKMYIFFSCTFSTGLTCALPACRLLCMSLELGWEL